MKLTLLLTLSLLGMISACSTAPKHVVVSPELIGYSKGVYLDNKIQLNVTDQRSSNYIVQIQQDDEPAKLLSSQNTLTNIIKETISPVLRKQGLGIDTFSNVYLDIMIDNALINVEQSLFSYTAKNTIALRVLVKNGDTVLTKNFNMSGSSNGPLKADIAVLERDFNNQLAATLVRITNSFEIQSAIKASTNTL
ncbi:YajG family lipoprotein [Pseudocolwellia sp. HL-MZ19]|uniref:YajG family lipoprotein n=1 Tax=unclassified Pseudocolwellia TaxID=2848178 RepID=UPI003CE7F754